MERWFEKRHIWNFTSFYHRFDAAKYARHAGKLRKKYITGGKGAAASRNEAMTATFLAALHAPFSRWAPRAMALHSLSAGQRLTRSLAECFLSRFELW